MLRSASLEPVDARSFDRRLLRRLQVQTVRDSVAYWRPALIGGVLAFVALFSTLDLLAGKAAAKSIHLPRGEAMRGAYPRFELSGPVHLTK